MIFAFVPHNFVWGSCFWFCIPGASASSSSSSSSRRSAYTHTHKLNTKLVTYHLSYTLLHTHKLNIHSYTHTHTTLSHTISSHTHKLNTQLWTHTQTHTTLSHTISSHTHTNLTHNFGHTQLCHTPSFTYNTSTCSHTTCPRTTLSHTMSHTIFHTPICHIPSLTYNLRGRRGTHGAGCPLRGRRGTWWHPPSFHVAGVAQTRHPPSFHVAGKAQTRIHLRFAWQAWHNLTSTIVLCGRRGTHGTGWRAWVWFRRALVARDAAALCVAGVALGDIHFRFTWQAWHNLTSTSVLRGRRGTISHPPSFRVAGVAQSHIHHRFVWQAWHSWHWVACLGLV